MSVFIVAELSGNHLGDKDRAIKLIHAAAEAGADAVKLQTLKPECMTMDGPDEYFRLKSGPWAGRKLIDLYREIYLPWEWHAELFHVARSLGLVCFSSPFHPEAVDFLETLDCPIYKVASFEVTDTPLLERIAKTGKRVFISGGMADEIATDLDVCDDADLTWMHCVSEYPAPLSSMNLRDMTNMGEPFGLSDHSLSPIPSIMATAMGATVIEKHLTLWRRDGGPDAGFSIEPAELRHLVEVIREAEQCLGEQQAFRHAIPHGLMKSLWVAQDVKEGDLITPENLRCLRPGDGVSPARYRILLGKRFNADITAGTPMKEHLCRNA